MYLQFFLFSTEVISLVGWSSYSHNSGISTASMISYQLNARNWLPPMSNYAGARNVLSNNSVYNYMHPGEKANASETAWIWICRFCHPAALYGQIKKGRCRRDIYAYTHSLFFDSLSHASYEGKGWQKHCKMFWRPYPQERDKIQGRRPTSNLFKKYDFAKHQNI